MAVKDAKFEENHDVACALASMLNEGKSFGDMMIARDTMQKELKDKVLARAEKKG